MRAVLLQALREDGGFHSGQDLAGRLGLSRTAVWKHIEALRRDGYVIEARARLGYRLLSAPDRLYPEELAPRLQGLRLGSCLYYHQTAGSTMDIARRLAEGGAGEGALVLAEAQQSGRGRLGRIWVSPFGLGLWFSLVLRPRLLPAQVTRITLLAAVAMARAVEAITGLQCGIKWPNDLFLGDRKVCGILTELKGQADVVDYLVTGIGVNVNLREEDFPPELRGRATSLLQEGGKIVDRLGLLEAFLREFEAEYFAWQERGHEVWLEEWRERNLTLGRLVKLSFLGDDYVGRAIDLDEDGGLVVETENGSRRVFRAGEVTLI